MMTAKPLRFLFDSILILAAGVVASALLLSTGPGAGLDERELDPRLSARSIEAVRAEKERSHSLRSVLTTRALAMLQGDFGRSEILNVPVADLVRDRFLQSFVTVGFAATTGFVCAGVLAGAVTLLLPQALRATMSGLFLALMSMPAGLIVLLAVFGRVPIGLAVAAVVTPKIYFYAARMFGEHRDAAYVLAAASSGITPIRITLFQVVPAIQSELAALLGLAVATAIAATIPAEVLSGTPGIGQLAWKGAMDRDMPVVIAVTMLMVLASRAVTLISSFSLRGSGLTA